MPALNTEHDVTEDNQGIRLRRPKVKLPETEEERKEYRRQYNKEYYQKNKELWNSEKYKLVRTRKKVCPTCNVQYMNGYKKKHDNTKYHQRIEAELAMKQIDPIN